MSEDEMKRTIAQENAYSAGMDSVWENNSPPAPTDPDLLEHYLAGEQRGEECRKGYDTDEDIEINAD